MNGLVKKQSPEERELASKETELKSLEATLAQRELDLATLRAELQKFELRYLQIVGVLYAELDEINAQIAEAEATQSPHDEEAQQEAAKARAEADESARTTESIKGSKPEEKFKPSDSLKKLYRELARLLHPDLALDEVEKARRHDLMAKANKAYADGDEELLAQMLAEEQNSPENVKGDGVGAELIRVIRRIAQAEGRLAKIDKEFASLEKSELFELKSKVEDAELEGRDLLREMALQVAAQIADARNRFRKSEPTKLGNE